MHTLYMAQACMSSERLVGWYWMIIKGLDEQPPCPDMGQDVNPETYSCKCRHLMGCRRCDTVSA